MRAKLTGAIGKKVADGKEMAYFSKKLIALCDEVPLDADLDSYGCSQLDKIAAARLLLREGLPSVAKLYAPDGAGEGESTAKADGGASSANKATAGASATAGAKGSAGDAAHSAIFTPPPFDGTAPGRPRQEYGRLPDHHRGRTNLNAIIDEAIRQRYAAFDTETTGLDIMKDTLVGFSLSLKAGTGYYVPVRGPTPELGETAHPLMGDEAANACLARLFGEPGLLLVTHNGKYDYQILKRRGVFSSIKCRLFDTMIAAWLLDPTGRPSRSNRSRRASSALRR